MYTICGKVQQIQMPPEIPSSEDTQSSVLDGLSPAQLKALEEVKPVYEKILKQPLSLEEVARIEYDAAQLEGEDEESEEDEEENESPPPPSREPA